MSILTLNFLGKFTDSYSVSLALAPVHNFFKMHFIFEFLEINGKDKKKAVKL